MSEVEHLSHLELDAIRLGQGRDDRRLAHLADCAQCRATASAIDASAAAFSQEFDVAALAAQTLAKAEPVWRSWLPRQPGLQLVAAAASLALVVAATLAVLAPDDGLRIKGGAEALELFVVTGGEAVPVRGGVAAGSTLRLRYQVGDARYLHLVWQDGAGSMTVMGAPIEVSGAGWLDRTIELDDALGTERLHGALCDRAIDASARLEVARGQTVDGCRHATVVVEKSRR